MAGFEKGTWLHVRDLRAELGAAMANAGSGLAAADGLCHACVQMLGVDGAAISLVYDGTTRGTFGSSGDLSRRLDEFQFTFGEGPCLDAVQLGRPVLVADVDDGQDVRWPAFAGAMLDMGVRAVFALPVAVARSTIGALDLFRVAAGPLEQEGLEGGLWAAELAALPLLDLMTADLDWANAAEGGDGWDELASLERVEVYQATGMLISALDVDATEALVRLRAYAFTHGMTASEAAWAIVERRIPLEGRDFRNRPSGGGAEDRG
jgi:GAF domain